MQDLALFAVGSQRAKWLAARGAALAGNIANADTPGYRARDVATFEQALASGAMRVAQTNAAHLHPNEPGDRQFDLVPRDGSEPKHSGNTVSLEEEMAALGQVRSQHALVSGVVGAFQRMLLQSSRG